MFGIGWLKSYFYNKIFDGGAALADKTENILDDKVVEIARRELRPILKFPSNSAAYIRSAITESLRASVAYARAHKKCKWLWKWLREVRNILNELDLDNKASK